MKSYFGALAVLALAACSGAQDSETPASTKTETQTERPDPVTVEDRFAVLALDCVHREYPNKISHVMQSAEDARPPHQLTPAFYGCFDWHSSVHGHWLLTRLLNTNPNTVFASEIREKLSKSFTAENFEAELAYYTAPGRNSFERPYGIAWYLQPRRRARRKRRCAATDLAGNVTPT